MKVLKKSLTMAAVAIIAFSAGSQPLIGNTNTVSAANGVYEMEYIDQLFYERLDNDGDGTYDCVQISRCDDEFAVSIEIPSEINGLPVTSIKGYAFNACYNLTSLSIPEGVTSIGDEAFLNTNLTNVIIPDSVTSIGIDTFKSTPLIIKNEENVKYVDKWVVSCDTWVTDAEIRPGTKGIANSAFSHCQGLTSVTIPEGVTYIGRNAFNGTGLTNVSIPDSVTSIGEGAFSGTGLTNVTIPEGVTSIGGAAFSYTGLTSVTIPDSLTEMGEEVFSDTPFLKNQTGIKYAGKWVVDCDKNVTEAEIKPETKGIAAFSFSYCTKLTSVTIPEEVTFIGIRAFDSCENLTSITIPERVSSIGFGTFMDCTNLKSITIKNPECEIYKSKSTISNETNANETDATYSGVICGYENSTAQAYAEKSGYKFESLGKSPFLRGDISGNGEIDLQDAVEIAKYIIGTRQFTDEEMKIADFNNDGEADLQDCVGIAKYILKTINTTKKDFSADLTANLKSQPVTGAEADEEFVLGQTEFALDLFKNTISDKENTLISPYSVMQALAMTANGADNNTKTQMEKVLGGMPIEKLNEYLYTWRTSQSFSTANSIWYRNNLDNFTVLPEFLQRNADYYSASAYSSPFDDTTVNDINNWVNEKTDEMIPKLLDSIPADICMYLINAVAFDAKWQNKYSDNDINEDGHFKAFDGSSQKVSMMSSTENQYLEDENATGFYKYYEGKRYAFAALLPKEEMSVSEYINTLTPESLYNTLSNPLKIKVKATIPKFGYDYDVKLNNTLSDMGMTDAFDELNADFTKMIKSEENIYIGSVIHKTHIEVTEEGTKAAAVTSVSMPADSVHQEEPKIVTLDRPFVYCIVDTQTSLPVFIGAVNSVEG